MLGRSPSYISSKCLVVGRPSKGGRGVVAGEPIAKDEIICIWGGRVVDAAGLSRLTRREREHSLQVADDFYLTSLGVEEAPSFINHSCDPNSGFSGQIVLVAMRDISPGEEIAFDYAMSDGSSYDEFTCTCRSPNCRGKITGRDWKQPALWRRYAGYISPYLERRIRSLEADGFLAHHRSHHQERR